MDLADSLFPAKLMLQIALVDVYGARLLLNMDAHSAKLPFIAPPLVMLSDHGKITLTYKGRHKFPRATASSCIHPNCCVQKANASGVLTAHCHLCLTSRFGRCHGAPGMHHLAQSL